MKSGLASVDRCEAGRGASVRGVAAGAAGSESSYDIDHWEGSTSILITFQFLESKMQHTAGPEVGNIRGRSRPIWKRPQRRSR
jgi:hypothetical protein